MDQFVIPAEAGRKKIVIYGYKENLNFFLKTPLQPVPAGTVTEKQVAVKAHQRRQYPGDTSLINVSATQREFMVDPTMKSGNALPGRSVTLVGDPGAIDEQRRTFTVVGRFVDFHAWFSTKAKMMTYVYNNTGARHTVAASTAP